jgi:catechol 2,3-dioxygenase-like lactoylglutathione lyase family enzyme
MQFAGVHHVSINVHDVDRALRFYVDVLGLTEIERPDLGFPGAWLAVGAQQIHLLEVPGSVPPQGQHFALHVADLDATLAELAEHGLDVSEPREIVGVCRQAFLEDPTGNLVELNEPAAATT